MVVSTIRSLRSLLDRLRLSREWSAGRRVRSRHDPDRHRGGFAATLDALGAELGVEFPTAEMTAQLGPPLDLILGPHLAPELIPGGSGPVPRDLPRDRGGADAGVPGVAAALAAVRRHHGRIVLVTGKHTPNAQLHVDHLGLDVDVVEGKVWGTGKGEVLARHGADIYVGDHVHDVEGARAAGILSVSVLTGGSTREELEAAGTDVVLDRPRRVPGVARRPPARDPAERARGAAPRRTHG